jgi:hypothetical protein
MVEVGPDVGNMVQLWEWPDLSSRCMDELHADSHYLARMKEIAENGQLTDRLESILLRTV